MAGPQQRNTAVYVESKPQIPEALQQTLQRAMVLFITVQTEESTFLLDGLEGLQLFLVTGQHQRYLVTVDAIRSDNTTYTVTHEHKPEQTNYVWYISE